MVKILVIISIVIIVLFNWFVTYALCRAAGRAEREMERYLEKTPSCGGTKTSNK